MFYPKALSTLFPIGRRTKGLRATVENIEPAARPQLSAGFNAIGERSHVLR